MLMKIYIKASSEKPTLLSVTTEWDELDSGEGIMFTVFDADENVIFEEVFDYQDVDPDQIYDSAAELAILSLSQQYELTDEVKSIIQGSE